jgi:hypothetical protein
LHRPLPASSLAPCPCRRSAPASRRSMSNRTSRKPRLLSRFAGEGGTPAETAAGHGGLRGDRDRGDRGDRGLGTVVSLPPVRNSHPINFACNCFIVAASSCSAGNICP